MVWTVGLGEGLPLPETPVPPLSRVPQHPDITHPHLLSGSSSQYCPGQELLPGSLCWYHRNCFPGSSEAEKGSGTQRPCRFWFTCPPQCSQECVCSRLWAGNVTKEGSSLTRTAPTESASFTTGPGGPTWRNPKPWAPENPGSSVRQCPSHLRVSVFLIDSGRQSGSLLCRCACQQLVGTPEAILVLALVFMSFSPLASSCGCCYL